MSEPPTKLLPPKLESPDVSPPLCLVIDQLDDLWTTKLERPDVSPPVCLVTDQLDDLWNYEDTYSFIGLAEACQK